MQNRNEKGITLLVGTVSLLFIVPMIGLVVDVGFLYATRSKLQAGVDGAALAAARALSIGVGLPAQTTSAQNNAVNWFNSNFPSGIYGTTGISMSTSNVNVAVDAKQFAIDRRYRDRHRSGRHILHEMAGIRRHYGGRHRNGVTPKRSHRDAGARPVVFNSDGQRMRHDEGRR